MATAKFIEQAKRPIYKRGKKVEYISQRGKHAGETKTKIDRNQPADERDEILINVGEGYWTWCFYGGSPIYSKTQPRPSQLTQNPFKQELYAISESVEDFETDDPEYISGFVEETKDNLESLRDTCQESLDNIPESLQDSSPAAEVLNNRIERLDEIINDLDSVDTDYDYESVISDLDRDTMDDTEWEQAVQEAIEEWILERISEIQEIDYEIE